jgi:hypothetical protein
MVASQDSSMDHGGLPARTRMDHAKIVFRAGLLKYVLDIFKLIGTASMPSEHIWNAP